MTKILLLLELGVIEADNPVSTNDVPVVETSDVCVA